MPRRKLKEYPELTAQFHWQCQDCMNEGVLPVRLPLQGRRLMQDLEDHHRKTRGPIACPSNYFAIVAVT